MRDIRILGVKFSDMNMKQTVEAIDKRIKSDSKNLLHVITGNPEILLASEKNTEIKEILEKAEIVTADGIGIVLAAKWRGTKFEERVTGVDLLHELLAKGDKEGYSFYLFGTDEDTNRTAAENIINKYKGLKIVGRHNGFFKPEESEAIIKDISACAPDILVVALGAPRSEKWVYENKNKLGAKMAIGVGGSLDVIAGKVKRSPEIWIKLNIEWLYRLLKQPSRFKRQLALPVFAAKAFADAMKYRLRK